MHVAKKINVRVMIARHLLMNLFNSVTDGRSKESTEVEKINHIATVTNMLAMRNGRPAGNSLSLTRKAENRRQIKAIIGNHRDSPGNPRWSRLYRETINTVGPGRLKSKSWRDDNTLGIAKNRMTGNAMQNTVLTDNLNIRRATVPVAKIDANTLAGLDSECAARQKSRTLGVLRYNHWAAITPSWQRKVRMYRNIQTS